MSPEATHAKDACPHCGKSVGLTMWNLLPSRENNRFLVCKACGGHYDLSNNCRMTSILGGMGGMALGMAFPFQWIVKAGHASKGSIVAGIAVAALCIGFASITAARLTLSLEAKR
ncbi:MAG TPA: hypothetical protein VLA79_11055 [Polyangia bacterium]|nr:hypothetical protein [Polyangia bacterium]